MRASRSVSLFIAICVSAALAACGGDDGESSDETTRLTQGEYDVLVRHHREAEELTEEDPQTEADVATYISEIRRQCSELSKAGPFLKSTEGSCRGAGDALEEFTTFAKETEKCGEGDISCVNGALESFVTGLDGFVRSYDESAKQIEKLEASSACRAALRGPEEPRDAFVAARDAARELIAAQKQLDEAQGDVQSEAAKRVEGAASRFEAATTAVDRLDDGVEESDPKPCEADVEKG